MKKYHEYLTRQFMLTDNYEVFHYHDTYIKDISLHHHDFYEIYYFISGDVSYLIEGKKYKLLPGDILIIMPDELHQPVLSDSNKPYERLVLWINKDFLPWISTDKTDLGLIFHQEGTQKQNLFKLPKEMQQEVKMAILKLIEAGGTSGYGEDLAGRLYITEVLYIINKCYLEGGFAELSNAVKQNDLIDNVLQYISYHIFYDITIDELSKAFFISKFYLSREFKKYTGTTIHRYIVQKKLIYAKEYILQGMPLTEVYLKCGFGDYCNFLRVFKNEYGITPRQYYKLMSK